MTTIKDLISITEVMYARNKENIKELKERNERLKSLLDYIKKIDKATADEMKYIENIIKDEMSKLYDTSSDSQAEYEYYKMRLKEITTH